LRTVMLLVVVTSVVLCAPWACQGAETAQLNDSGNYSSGAIFHQTQKPRILLTAQAGGNKAESVSGEAKTGETETVRIPDSGEFNLLTRDPLDLIRLDNINPLYTSPKMSGEGVWQSADSPRDPKGRPVIYETFYRPSVDFPNAIVYMMVVDMSKVFMQYYVGTQEPGAYKAASSVERDMRPRIMAFTNAMWMERHSSGAGAMFRGNVIYPMVNGMATLIVYKDGSVDIREWGPDIPADLVRDARQLKHLVVKDGMVVQNVLKHGKLADSEIGLGFLLGGGGRDQDGKQHWYVADRSAFGIRRDGNLVFAIGHHIGTKDLAKALVLAGCVRGMHGDANPDNIVANLYIRDAYGNLVTKHRLSPEQPKYSLKRYEAAYTKDFFGFFLRDSDNAAQHRTLSSQAN
jgi:hypothetical protein